MASRIDGSGHAICSLRFTAGGVPVYDLARGETLVDKAQTPTSSGGDQALVAADGWTILTVAPQPFAPQSVGGALHGKPMWSYPDLWPGLHASHESPPPDRPGELIGTTRLLGDFVTPKDSDAGPLWAINGNMGNVYLFTADGLFVATLFHDSRLGRPWAMPIARRDMLLNDLTLHDENFWPSITQTADGKVYLVDGGRTSLVRVDGLESIRRLPEHRSDNLARRIATGRRVSGAERIAAAAESRPRQADRDDPHRPPRPSTASSTTGPAPRGSTSTRAASRPSSTAIRKPHNVTAALAVAGDRFYAAFKVDDPNLLNNSGELLRNLFKTGGGARSDDRRRPAPAADPHRDHAVAGDERLLVTRVKGKTVAMLYQPVAAGANDEPVAFSSPLRTIRFDRVADVSDQVNSASTVEKNEKHAHRDGDSSNSRSRWPRWASSRGPARRFAATSASCAEPNSKRSSALLAEQSHGHHGRHSQRSRTDAPALGHLRIQARSCDQ